MTLLPLLLLLAFQDPPATPRAEPVPAPAEGEVAADAGEIFVQANAAYESGDYARAVALYQALLERGRAGGHLYYNLGNAHLRRGELGRAVAAYRRSRNLLPRDEDVAANLAFARKSARDALRPPEPSPVVGTLFFWHHGLSRRELEWTMAVVNALFWGLLLLRLVRRRSEVLRWLSFAAGALLLVAGTSLALRAWRPSRVAVVVPQEIDAHAGTRSDSVVRFKLHAGTEVAVSEVRDGWLRIRLPDGEQAWIDERHAELVAG